MQSIIAPGSVRLLAAGGSAAVLGWLIAGHRASWALAAVAVPALALAYRALGRWRIGVICGLLTVAVLDGLPLINTDSLQGPPPFRGLTMDILLAVVAVWALANGWQRDELSRRALAWSSLFLGWWLFELVRAVGFENVPVKQAILADFDYLFFGLLVALLPMALRTREDRMAIFGVLATAGTLFSAAVVLRDVAGVNSSAVIHNDLSTLVGSGYVRDYSAMSNVAGAMVPFGVGLLLLGQGPRLRILGAATAVLAGAAVTLEFGRAVYFGLIAGLFVGTALWVVRGPHARSVRISAGVILATLVTLAICLALFDHTHHSVTPQNEHTAVYNVVQRLEQGINDVNTNGGTFGARTAIGSQDLHVLGSQWPIGMGLLYPTAHYVYPLVGGNIRNNNVGVLNILMPMGAVGTVLLYLPLLALLLYCLQSCLKPERQEQWIAYGGAMWLIALIAASVTTVALFTPVGLAFVAVVGVCTARAARAEPEPGVATAAFRMASLART